MFFLPLLSTLFLFSLVSCDPPYQISLPLWNNSTKNSKCPSSLTLTGILDADGSKTPIFTKKVDIGNLPFTWHKVDMKPVNDLKAITVQWTADDANTEGCKDLAEYTH